MKSSGSNGSSLQGCMIKCWRFLCHVIFIYTKDYFVLTIILGHKINYEGVLNQLWTDSQFFCIDICLIFIWSSSNVYCFKQDQVLAKQGIFTHQERCLWCSFTTAREFICVVDTDSAPRQMFISSPNITLPLCKTVATVSIEQWYCLSARESSSW